MASKNRVTINLKDHEYERLTELSAKTERSLAWIGRRAICEFLDKSDANPPPKKADKKSAAAAHRNHAQ